MEIRALDHKNPSEARRIWRVLRDAYLFEASLIGAAEFPPLHRTADEISSGETKFHGVCEAGRLLAVCEVGIKDDAHWEIASFGVEPNALQRGYGSMLLSYLISVAEGVELCVSTASANTPGVNFYEKHGFSPFNEWTTREGIAITTMVRHAC